MKLSGKLKQKIRKLFHMDRPATRRQYNPLVDSIWDKIPLYDPTRSTRDWREWTPKMMAARRAAGMGPRVKNPAIAAHINAMHAAWATARGFTV